MLMGISALNGRERPRWGKLDDQELCHLYSSLNILRIIKSRRKRLTGN
jgi:hypothetical protein